MAARRSVPQMPRLIPVVILVAILATPALACPVCDSGTGEQVRAGILDEQFAFNVFATLVPFPILVGVAAFIHFGGRGGKS